MLHRESNPGHSCSRSTLSYHRKLVLHVLVLTYITNINYHELRLEWLRSLHSLIITSMVGIPKALKFVLKVFGLP